MENKPIKTGFAAMFERSNKTKVSQPRNITREVEKEAKVFKNSRQRYRARRREEFLRQQRGEHTCFMFEDRHYFVASSRKGGEESDHIQ